MGIGTNSASPHVLVVGRDAKVSAYAHHGHGDPPHNVRASFGVKTGNESVRAVSPVAAE
jgi:hypothetical protein